MCLIKEDWLIYRPFQKTLPKSSLQMHWISVRFYEMGDSGHWQILILQNREKTEIFEIK